MVIRALDIVETCNTANDGRHVYERLLSPLKRGERVNLSFEGVRDVPSSFVNAAIVRLLDHFEPSELRSNLILSHANSQVADMVVRCMSNGIRRRNTGAS